MGIVTSASTPSETYSGIDGDGDTYTTSVSVMGRRITWSTTYTYGDGSGGSTEQVTINIDSTYQRGSAVGEDVETDGSRTTFSGALTRLG